MKKVIDQNEIIKIVFDRNVDSLIIKPSMIDISQENYLWEFLGDFYLKMLNNDEYIEYIEMYLKPIVAWGVLLNNFDGISFQITDKGLFTLLSESGAQLLGSENIYNSKIEIKRNLFTLIKIMLRNFEYEKENGNELFEDFKVIKYPKMIKYDFSEKIIRNLY